MQESEPGMASLLEMIDLEWESEDKLTLFAPIEAAFLHAANFVQTLDSAGFKDVSSSC